MLTLLPPPAHEALIAAVKANRRHDVADLLAAGAPVNPPQGDRMETTALHEAVSAGRLAMAKLLLNAGADASRHNTYGSAAVHVAALAGHSRCVAEMLRHVEIDLRDRDGRTPLHEAVQGGHLGTVALLVVRGAAIDARDSRGRTALSKVYDKLDDRPDVASSMTKLLLSAGACTMHDGETLCETPLIAAVTAGDDALVAKLARTHPDSIDIVHFRLGGALHVAAAKGAETTVDLLLEAGASPALESQRGIPLQCAAACGHAAIVRKLLDVAPHELNGTHAADPALVLAAAAGSGETVAALLDAGADPHAQDKHGRSARDVAANADVREQLRRVLLKARPRVRRRPPVPNAPALAKLLASEGVDSSRIPAHTALQAAAAVRSVEVIELLLRAGAKVLDADVPKGWEVTSVVLLPGRRGPTKRSAWPNAEALVTLAEGLSGGLADFDWSRGDEDAALAWLDANPTRTNAHYVDALTPLHMAAAYDMPAVVTRLIELGAYLEVTTNLGETPLTLAAQRAGQATVERLLWAGANPEGTSARHKPLAIACKAGNAEAVTALLAAGAAVDAVTKAHW